MKKKIKLIVFMIVVAFITYNLTAFFTKDSRTVIAQIDKIEITKTFEGIVCRDEQLITFEVPNGGVLDLSVSEGEMVKRGKLLGVCYDSDIDDAKKKKLAEINKKIAQINSSPSSVDALEIDPAKLEKQVGQIITQIIDIAPERDITQISSYKDDASSLLARKLTVEGNTGAAADTVESLRMEKMQIEREYGGKKTDIISPAHGVFSTRIDSFEEILTPNKATDITPSELESVRKSEKKEKETKKDVIGKLVDNSNLWICMETDEKDAKDFETGESVTLRLSTGENISTKVEYISRAEGGKCVITFLTGDYIEEAFSSRTISAVAVQESYTGFKIPLEAVRVKDEKTGVYVRTDTNIKFREIDVIYKNDEFAIAKVDNHKANALLLYDEIVLDAEA